MSRLYYGLEAVIFVRLTKDTSTLSVLGLTVSRVPQQLARLVVLNVELGRSGAKFNTIPGDLGAIIWGGAQTKAFV